MSHSHSRCRPGLAGLAAIFSLLAPCILAAATWENDWIYPAPPYLSSVAASYPPPAPVAFAAGGEVMFAGATVNPSGAQITRLNGAGNLRWIAHTDYLNILDFATANDLIANDDGSAFVAFGGAESSRIAKLTSEGAIAWMRELFATSIARLPGERLAANGCGGLVVLAADSDNLLWQRNVFGDTGCVRGLLTDGPGNIYTGFVHDGLLQLVKRDVAGNILFQTQGGASSTEDIRSLVGIDAVNIYVRVNDELRAFRQGDGTAVWTRQFADWHSTINAPDASAEPVILGSHSIRRLSASTGYPRWTRTLTNGNVAASMGGALLVQADTSLLRLHPAVGIRLWTSPLPEVDASGRALRWHAFGGLSNGRIIGVGRTHEGDQAAHPFLQPVDIHSGALLPKVSAPLVSQGINGASKLYGTRLISAAQGFASTGPQVRLRAVNASDGVDLWENTDPILVGDLDPYDDSRPQFAIGHELIVVASALSQSNDDAPPSGISRI